MNSDSAIYVQGLRKSCGALEAVKGIDFEVKAGEVFGLLGPNGVVRDLSHGSRGQSPSGQTETRGNRQASQPITHAAAKID